MLYVYPNMFKKLLKHLKQKLHIIIIFNRPCRRTIKFENDSFSTEDVITNTSARSFLLQDQQFMRILTTLLLLLFVFQNFCFAQDPPFTKAEKRLEEAAKRKSLADNSILKNVAFRNIGPSVFSGRIVDVEVDENDPSHFFAAYASGGLWWTENNGTTFEPLFDEEVVMTIGDIAVNWQDSIIWIGTGEVNSSRSSYAGVGLYKSMDWGKTWTHIGLQETHHTARIILHPTDANIAWVACLGHLYSPNEERGVYKTTDGGKTWSKTLFVDENSGAIDLLIDPSNPDILYASTWHRERRAWNFVESGNGSGIYKSIDAGANWEKLTNEGAGFPIGEGVGRIGIALHKSKSKTTLYALLDNYDRRPEEKDNEVAGLSKKELCAMSKEAFLALPQKKVESYLDDNGFPEKYDYDAVLKLLKKDEIKVSDLVDYTEDANQLLFDTPVIGAEVYRSDDEGKSWYKTHEDYLDQVYNSYGYYFGQIRVSPHDADKIYFAGVPVVRSDDGGKTFENINGKNVHVDHHALWCNPNRDKHIILGNDGGINISYDDGESWIKCNYPPVGQFYAIAYDMEEPYNVYGGLQDNGVWVGSSKYKKSSRWFNTGHYPYKELLGGDGMQIAIDNRDNNTVYTGFQFGWYFRVDKTTGEQTLIKPKHELGERPLRFNWQTPIHLSKFNQDILYLGANKLYRSMDKGESWNAISEDLTKGGRKGDVPYGTLTCIDESAFQFGKIFIGTDDGNIYSTTNGGTSWENKSAGLPANLWVTAAIQSKHVKNRVYASLNGYRWDDFNAYLFVSDDEGNNWEQIGQALPAEPINVVYEDPKNENILYVGTDNGLYISLDQGKTYAMMTNGLPAVSVHDVEVHPRENELIVGTHGRSIYLADVSVIQSLNAELQNSEIYVYDLKPSRLKRGLGAKKNIWSSDDKKVLSIPFYVKNDGKTKIEIKDKNDLVLFKDEMDAFAGINYYEYNYKLNNKSVDKFIKSLKDQKVEKKDDGNYYIPKGEYKFVMSKAGQEASGKLIFE